jgi:hypothetical protein
MKIYLDFFYNKVYIPYMIVYWQRIKEILDTIGKSWTWLATQIGIDQSNLSKKIKAGTYPDADAHNKICNLLGVTSRFLFDETGDQFAPHLIDIYAQLPSLSPAEANAVRALIFGMRNLSHDNHAQ